MSVTKQPLVHLIIDGETIFVPAGTSILEVAWQRKIDIPVLCHEQDRCPVGVCRLCVVDVHGRYGYTAACTLKAEVNDFKRNLNDPDLVIETNTEGVVAARKTLLEMFMADHGAPCVRQQHTHDCELEMLAAKFGITLARYPATKAARPLDSSQSIVVDHSACVLCDRCVRACADAGYFVIAREGKGFDVGIAFDLNSPLSASSCVSCLECVYSCPTGALINKVTVNESLGVHLRTQETTELSADKLSRFGIFDQVSSTFFDFNRSAVVQHRVNQGEILFREDEYGDTVFYLLEGKIDIFNSGASAGPKPEISPATVLKFWLDKVRHKYIQRKAEGARDIVPTSEEPLRRLLHDRPTLQLESGQWFGDMPYWGSSERAVTACAASDCMILEMSHSVFSMILRKDKAIRIALESEHRERALDSYLKYLPFFFLLTSEFIKSLRPRLKLNRYSPGQVIYAQGNMADAFFLVGMGSVKATVNLENGELVQRYFSKGDYFGERTLLLDNKYGETCSAEDYVEVVRIDREDFIEMSRLFPEIPANIQAVAQRQEALSVSHDITYVAVAAFDHSWQILTLRYDSNYQIIDAKHNLHNILYFPQQEVHAYRLAVAGLERLVNDQNAKEAEFRNLFLRFSYFISNYDSAYMRIILTRQSKQSPAANFAIDPGDQTFLWNAIKLPQAPIRSHEMNRRLFAAAITDARAQLQAHSGLIDEPEICETIQQNYGIKGWHPRLVAIIGVLTAGSSRNRWKAEAAKAELQVRAYDEITNGMKFTLKKLPIGSNHLPLSDRVGLVFHTEKSS